MKRKATLDKTGRVLLRPHRVIPPLGKARGVWALRTGERRTGAETRETLRAIREKRARRQARDLSEGVS